MLLSPASFYHSIANGRVVDARPANLFVKGSLPGAMSLPREQFTSSTDFLQALKRLARELPVHLIDVDGALALEIIKDNDVTCLEGGYAAFKQWRETVFSDGPQMAMIGGKTGSGKTEALEILEQSGRQAIHFERLAQHRGSVFGRFSIVQPTHEDFQNTLLKKWLSLDPQKLVWVEEKGPVLGKVGLPESLFQKMSRAVIVEWEAGYDNRLQHLLDEYGSIDKEQFADNIRKLQSRLGMSAYHKALHFHHSGQLQKCFRILLDYYDKAYTNKRALRQPAAVFSTTLSALRHQENVSNLENMITEFYKMKDPAAFAAGTPLNVNRHSILSTLRLKV
jgi:hypothetical protein